MITLTSHQLRMNTPYLFPPRVSPDKCWVSKYLKRPSSPSSVSLYILVIHTFFLFLHDKYRLLTITEQVDEAVTLYASRRYRVRISGRIPATLAEVFRGFPLTVKANDGIVGTLKEATTICFKILNLLTIHDDHWRHITSAVETASLNNLRILRVKALQKPKTQAMHVFPSLKPKT
jgi:hypothetical protein